MNEHNKEPESLPTPAGLADMIRQGKEVQAIRDAFAGKNDAKEKHKPS